jgi:hypothetical protein
MKIGKIMLKEIRVGLVVLIVAVIATAPVAVVEKFNALDHTVETTSIPPELTIDYNIGGGSSNGLDLASESTSDALDFPVNLVV